MSSPFFAISDARKADLLLGTSLSAHFVLSFYLCSPPTWFALVIGPIAGSWSVLVLHGARRAHEHESGPSPPLTVAAALRIVLFAVLLWAIVASVALAYWLSRR